MQNRAKEMTELIRLREEFVSGAERKPQMEATD